MADNKADILDLSVLPFGEESDLNSHSNAWHGPLIDFKETSHSRTTNVLEMKGLRTAMSEEELKIRSELEMEIERDLEEEIKDGIYHHALRLHRLYQQQKERIAKEGPGFETFQAQQRKNSQTLLEVNISIRMEGGTKIEIKETKKEAHDHHQEKGRPRTSRSENMQPFQPVSNGKKLDWVRSLRFNAGPVAIDRSSKHGSLHQPKTPSNNRCCYDLNLDLKNARRICTASVLGQPKVRASVDNKVLELGWKN
ncbi:uncharacterized protein LOC122301667 isoform X1 [Carya illinoinensis]|uniref:Uncharacterized protein n=1 Tax=Carya illinoinensis TaxID=32201 RepID=A0A922FZR1_CARIL|nr:uncharacterized protein LOC122301667 isoform X1 [Carya illinoinensis]KAG6729737.1 hypothetical protein I3842_01G046000 [Carya illinoinensis]